MKNNFKILADKFSTLNEQDNKDFISFYKNNETEIEDLNDFESDEELYLSAVINHTYGRSLLYETKDYKKAERHLDIARSLILNNSSKFNLKLKDDVWYLQTLQHLLTISLYSNNYNKSAGLLRELKLIDSDNPIKYQPEEKELNRIRRYKVFMMLIYFGMGLIITSMIYRFVTSTSMELIDILGIVVGIIGIIGGYANKNRVKKQNPT
ncbi:MAG: hypothetical protein EBR30_11675 [Cytophagia bacterium]|nr:hypothetical protein [Cytophagia bacterium]